ncbi:MAG TPA: hypothetical protein VKK81_22705 [Candidatus Binatia bacterium]|nr:hypothetical protein [Candidatus Binatia bacterium]
MVATLVIVLIELADVTAAILTRQGARSRARCLEGPVDKALANTLAA